MNGLPVRQPTQAPPHPDATRSAGILLVEDEQDAALVTRMALELSGFNVKLTDTTTGAIAEMAAFDPIVVVVDLGLSDGQAFRLIEQINKVGNGEIPIVALSGSRRTNVFERCMSLGVSDFISKPFSPSELIKRISACARA